MKTTRLATGIRGLDAILHRGLALPSPDDSERPTGAILIRGAAGTGKTLLAATIALRAARVAGDERGSAMHFVVEQNPDEVAHVVGTFERALGATYMTARAFADTGPAAAAFGVVDAIDPGYVHRGDPAGASSPIRAQFDRLRKALVDSGRVPAACVFDSVVRGAPFTEKLDRLTFHDIARYGADHGMLMIVVEEADGAPDWLPYVCDVVIQLSPAAQTYSAEAPMRRLSVQKSRFGGYVEGGHPYEIQAERGLVAYPSLHAYFHRVAGPMTLGREDERLPFGWAAIDRGVPEGDGIIARGSATLLRSADEALLREPSVRFLSRFTDPDREFNANLGLQPRNVALTRFDKEPHGRIAPAGSVLGDFGTPPEKLYFLFRETIEGWQQAGAGTLGRLRVGNLGSFRAYPTAATERLMQCVQLIVREMETLGVTVLLTASPEVPGAFAFEPQQAIDVRSESGHYVASVRSRTLRANVSCTDEDLGFERIVLQPDDQSQ